MDETTKVFKINWEALASDLAEKSVACDKLLKEILESKSLPIELENKVREFLRTMP